MRSVLALPVPNLERHDVAPERLVTGTGLARGPEARQGSSRSSGTPQLTPTPSIASSSGTSRALATVLV